MQIHFVANSLKVKYILCKMCLLENLENAHKILAKINDIFPIFGNDYHRHDIPFFSFFYTMCNMKEYLIFLYLLLLPIFFIPFPPCIVFLLLVLDFFWIDSIGLKIGHDTYAAVVAVCL